MGFCNLFVSIVVYIFVSVCVMGVCLFMFLFLNVILYFSYVAKYIACVGFAFNFAADIF